MVNRDVIRLSYIINHLVFTCDYKESFDSLPEDGKRLVFTNLCFNIIKKTFVTKFDSNVTERLYSLLSIYRDIYKDANDNEIINEAISTLNNLTYPKTLYIPEFHDRFKYLHNYFKRHKLIKNDMSYVKESVDLSIASDIVFFDELCELPIEDFIEGHMTNYMSLTNIAALAVNYPEVFSDKELLRKILSLLNCNIEFNKKHPEIGNQLGISSIFTKEKVYKKMRYRL